MNTNLMIVNLNIEEWEKDLDQYFHSIFISSKWISSIQTPTKKAVFYDIYSHNNKIGKISGIIEETHLGKQLFFYAGPGLKEISQAIYSKCLNDLYSYAKKNGYSRITISSYDNKHSLEYCGTNYYTTKRVEYVVPIHKGIEAITSNKRFKRNIKKAEKLTVNIEQSQNTGLLTTLNTLLNATLDIRTSKYQKKYSPYYLKNMSSDTLIKLLQNGLATIYYTSYHNTIDCMEYNLICNNYVYMLLKGTNELGYKNGLSSYLSDKLIKKYAQDNIEYYNQGGRPSTIDGEGLAAFKKSMGAEEIIMYGATTNYITWPFKLLNPILLIGRKLPQENYIIKLLKRFL